MESYLVSFLESYVSIASECRFICISKITAHVRVCVCVYACTHAYAHVLVCVSEAGIIFVVPFYNPVGIPEIFNSFFLYTRNSVVFLLVFCSYLCLFKHLTFHWCILNS